VTAEILPIVENICGLLVTSLITLGTIGLYNRLKIQREHQDTSLKGPFERFPDLETMAGDLRVHTAGYARIEPAFLKAERCQSGLKVSTPSATAIR
jgi:hypothetical protein